MPLCVLNFCFYFLEFFVSLVKLIVYNIVLFYYRYRIVKRYKVNQNGTKKLPHRTTLTVEQKELALTQAKRDTELLISIRSLDYCPLYNGRFTTMPTVN